MISNIENILTPSPNKVFFTSDTHFGHATIIKYCSRPYKSVEEMNECLIDNWNSKVKKDDIVYHLGDFIFGGSQLWHRIVSKLNGNIVLIMGNHDARNLKKEYDNTLYYRTQQLKINVGGDKIYLNHFPFLCYDYKNAIQLYGHVHSGPKSTSLDLKRLEMCYPEQYDVGVDNNNYYPISYYEMKDIIAKRKEKSLSQRM